MSYTEDDLPSLLRRLDAAAMVRQFSTWVGRGSAAPAPRALPGALPGGGWAGLRQRRRGFAASAA